MNIKKCTIGIVCAALLLVGCSAQQPVTSEDVVTELPPTKNIELTVEGQQEVRLGTLFKSTQGYAMYVLPQVQASAEEPGKDILFAKVDSNYFVRIERLDPAANLNDLRQNAETELSSIGKVHELKGKEIFDPHFRKAKFFLHASNSQVSKNIVVIDIDGSLFRFNMHIPNGEAAEGIVPTFWAVLKTIQVTGENLQELK